MNVGDVINNVLIKDMLSQMLKDKCAKKCPQEIYAIIKDGFFSAGQGIFLCVTVVKFIDGLSH